MALGFFFKKIPLTRGPNIFLLFERVKALYHFLSSILYFGTDPQTKPNVEFIEGYFMSDDKRTGLCMAEPAHFFLNKQTSQFLVYLLENGKWYYRSGWILTPDQRKLLENDKVLLSGCHFDP